MAEVPDMVLRLVLIRLPVKYILRCRVVSRLWNQILRSPEFIDEHLLFNSMKPPGLIFHVYSAVFRDNRIRRTTIINRTVITRQIVFPPEVELISSRLRGIVGSIRGLVCFDISGAEAESIYVLWNPTLRESRRLPEASLTATRTRGIFSIFTGFGYDSCENAYKIIRIITFENGITSVELYSTRTDRWRILEVFPIPHLAIISRDGQEEGTFVGYKLNWKGTGTGVFPNRKVIISFDCRSEVFEILPLEPPITGIGPLKIISYTGSMSGLFFRRVGENLRNLEFWVREGEIWERRHVHVGYPLNHLPLVSWCDKLVVWLMNDDEFGRCAMLYDPWNQVNRNVLTRFQGEDLVRCCTYVASLVPASIGN